jgi:glycine/D-amino acid oxidase-like deaminating enzyme
VILNIGYGGTGVALTLACARLAAGLALGRQTSRDDARLLATIQDSRIGVLDGVRALGRIGRGVFSR